MSSETARDIVLPLGMIIGLLGNALFIGIAYGRITTTMETSTAAIQALQKDSRYQDARLNDMDKTVALMKEKKGCR